MKTLPYTLVRRYVGPQKPVAAFSVPFGFFRRVIKAVRRILGEDGTQGLAFRCKASGQNSVAFEFDSAGVWACINNWDIGVRLNLPGAGPGGNGWVVVPAKALLELAAAVKRAKKVVISVGTEGGLLHAPCRGGGNSIPFATLKEEQDPVIGLTEPDTRIGSIPAETVSAMMTAMQFSGGPRDRDHLQTVVLHQAGVSSCNGRCLFVASIDLPEFPLGGLNIPKIVPLDLLTPGEACEVLTSDVPLFGEGHANSARHVLLRQKRTEVAVRFGNFLQKSPTMPALPLMAEYGAIDEKAARRLQKALMPRGRYQTVKKVFLDQTTRGLVLRAETGARTLLPLSDPLAQLVSFETDGACLRKALAIGMRQVSIAPWGGGRRLVLDRGKRQSLMLTTVAAV